MKNILTYYFLFIFELSNFLFGQMMPYEEPSLIQNSYKKLVPMYSFSSEDLDEVLNINIINNGILNQINSNTHLLYTLNLSEDNIYDLSFDYQNIPIGSKLFIIESDKFLGPLLLGVVTQAFNSQRYGIFVVVILLLIGFILMSRVDEEKGISQREIV